MLLSKMSIHLKCLFKKCTGTIQFEDGRPNEPKDFKNKEITRIVKIGIIFGIITSMLFLALTIVYFKVPQMEVYLKVPEVEYGCQINPFVADPSPLLVISGSNSFIYPKHREKTLRFVPGQSIDFVCPGGTVTWGQSETKNLVISGSCVKGSTLRINNVEVDWRDIKCSISPVSTIKYNGKNCYNNSKEIEVGFQIAKNRFLRSLLICFNPDLQTALYTYAPIPSSINQRILFTKRPDFQQGTEFYKIGQVKNLYTRKNQRNTVNKLLGLPNGSTTYIKDNNDFFLSRGHLAANMDNFYAAQQNATFYYPNVAPQWQTFNGYNWNQIEIDVRDYAEANAADLQVWTGVHGVAKIPSAETGKPVELFLFFDPTTNRTALPVPEIYWKVVYNPETQKGIAIIGVNNPYVASYAKICQDVSTKLTWLHYEKENQQKGFCYACSIDDFRKAVTSMPYVSSKGLLL